MAIWKLFNKYVVEQYRLEENMKALLYDRLCRLYDRLQTRWKEELLRLHPEVAQRGRDNPGGLKAIKYEAIMKCRSKSSVKRLKQKEKAKHDAFARSWGGKRIMKPPSLPAEVTAKFSRRVEV